MSPAFRELAAKVLERAQQRRIESTDWGDAVSLEFSDGYDALHVTPSSVDGRSIQQQVGQIFEHHKEFDQKRSRVLNALRWLCHHEGSRLELESSGWGLLEYGCVSLTLGVGRELTWRLERLGEAGGASRAAVGAGRHLAALP